jgi:hypothetical protein
MIQRGSKWIILVHVVQLPAPLLGNAFDGATEKMP